MGKIVNLKIASNGSRCVAAKRTPRWLAKKYKRQLVVVGAGVVVIAALLAVSLRHQAFTTIHITHVAAFEGWCMAIAIDAGYITMESLSVFAATAAIRKGIDKWAIPATAALAALSVAQNVYAFNYEAQGYVEHGFATVIGFAIPVLMYAAFKAVSHAYLTATK